MNYDQLKLVNQICFPVYAASRLITREYQPFLEKLEITYPQYLVLMVLWEHEGITVNKIAGKLILNTNTLTPLLKRMEMQGIITRKRSEEDERKVLIHLTKKGKEMRVSAATIPEELLKKIDSKEFDLNQLIKLREILNNLIEQLK